MPVRYNGASSITKIYN